LLKERVITAIILLILAFGWLFFTKGIVFSGIVLLVCMIGFCELLNMYKFSLVPKILAILLLTVLAFSLYYVNYNFAPIIRFLIVLFWCFLIPIILAIQPQNFSKITIMILGGIIFILAFYALIVLQLVLGSWQLLSIMAVAWIADTGAYFIGKKLGRHKLASSISPGKSIEGAIGGLVCVFCYLLFLKKFMHVNYLYNIMAIVKFTLIVGIISIMGDLFESWLKRVAKVKDSGAILPGHGGVFDRIDSLVGVVAIAYALLYNFL
jgi:phosphatidate cytidylyltransferase